MKVLKMGIVLLLVLVATGAVMSTTVIANNFVTSDGKVDIGEIKENYAFIVKDFDKGISLEEIKKIRQNFINKIKSKYPERVVAFAVPDIPEGARIVDYGIKLDKNGVTSQYFGFAYNREFIN